MYKEHDFSKNQMENFHHTLLNEGYLFIDKVGDNFDHFNFVQEFGKLIPQYDGKIIWSIKADPKYDDHYHSLNTKKLSPHTECYEFAGTPPKYLALWCETPSECGGGQTTLFDSNKFICGLEKNQLGTLLNKKLKFVSSSGIQASELGLSAEHTMITASQKNDESIFRFSRNCIQDNTNQDVVDISDALVDQFENDHVSFDWKKNSFLIWDNHRVVHSRTSYKDRSRELKRVWLA